MTMKLQADSRAGRERETIASKWRQYCLHLYRWLGDEGVHCGCMIYKLKLTRRELQVLRLIATDMSNGEIASALFITEGTVKIHVHHILSKLGRCLLRHFSPGCLRGHGLLYLRGGSWRESQLISAQWVRESTTAYFVADGNARDGYSGYGYLWWVGVNGNHYPKVELLDGSFSAWGAGGHFMAWAGPFDCSSGRFVRALENF